MAAEQVDDAGGALQIGTLAGHRVPGEEGFEQMHVRVGAPHLLAVRCFEEAGQAVSSRCVSRKAKVSSPSGSASGIADTMRMRQRQQHAGMVVGILGGVGDRAVDIAACARSRRGRCGHCSAMKSMPWLDQRSAGPSQPRALATAKA